MKQMLLSALLISTCVACGGDEDEKVTRSCNFDAEDYCDTVTATAKVLDAADYTQASCVGAGGTYGTSCSSTSRVGRCTQTGGGITLVEHLYSPSYDTESAQSACNELGGSFEAN